ncbi:hypothetical protein TNCV_2787591 [Trichonephila clavipes]|uniref:Uncharacterized protein n=1 Tax=Trichonephila clavipes TaxID=2585209 RepID=A0A8X6SS40_TRICX|nr:hypothetical protein TNCV_2787591 [Trichonephila clavipes]
MLLYIPLKQERKRQVHLTGPHKNVTNQVLISRSIPGKYPSSPEDEQEKQGQGMDFRTVQDRGTGVGEIPTPLPASSSAASFPGTPTCDGIYWRHTWTIPIIKK